MPLGKKEKKNLSCEIIYIGKQLRQHSLWIKVSISPCSKSGRDSSSITEKCLEINTCDSKVKWFVPNNSGKAETEVSSGWQFYNTAITPVNYYLLIWRLKKPTQARVWHSSRKYIKETVELSKLTDQNNPCWLPHQHKMIITCAHEDQNDDFAQVIQK